MSEKDKLLRTIRHFIYIIILLTTIGAIIGYLLLFGSYADEMKYYIEINQELTEKLKECYTE